MINQLNRKIRIAGLVQKSRSNQTKSINSKFENAIRQQNHNHFRSKSVVKIALNLFSGVAYRTQNESGRSSHHSKRRNKDLDY